MPHGATAQQMSPGKMAQHALRRHSWRRVGCCAVVAGGHILPHSAQPQHTNYWAPRTRKRQQQEHRPQRPTERSDPTQHAKGRKGDCPGPVKKQQPNGMSHRGACCVPSLWEVCCAATLRGLLHCHCRGVLRRRSWGPCYAVAPVCGALSLWNNDTPRSDGAAHPPH